MYYPVIVWDYISWAIMATLHATKKNCHVSSKFFLGAPKTGQLNLHLKGLI